MLNEVKHLVKVRSTEYWREGFSFNLEMGKVEAMSWGAKFGTCRDVELGLAPRATKKQLEAAMEGHILARAELIGRYGR